MVSHDKSAGHWLVLGLPIALGLAWITQGTGVIENDPERNIWIPDQLTMPLQVQAAYNGDRIFFRYRWPAEQAYVYHDMLRYQEGEWIRHGTSPIGPDLDNTYEDRVTMLVDDGSVPQFGRYGGYITVGDQMRFFSNSASPAEVSEHPHLGEALGQNDVRKYLPGTRSDQQDWRSVVDAEQLTAQREAGYFLDLWHWRAGRSNPIDASDDQWVGEFRFGDSGSGPYTTNWDGDQPRWMFDPSAVDRHALRWEDVEANRYDFEGLYYLAEAFAIEFDPDRDWQDGDVIPRRLLREPTGSRGDIAVHGQARWEEGYWDVTLVRDMDTRSPLDDKAFREQGVYDIGIAVHRNATGSRWHYVSHPYSLGLGRDADIPAMAFNGDTPGWGDDWFEMTLFYPGQVDWPLLVSRAHAGAEDIAAGKPVRPRHSEKQLALYGVEMEFNDAITTRWWMTLLAGLIAMLGVTLALLPSFRPIRQGARS
ncbi:ethylbenzene dehydrogenase-related protein [Halomonas alkalisoli]|uniref:ethylbenzene dehydrogenase-related protein n=1 Tax=Halomonas alkalisoli TaxID=2907158 RepID=UPI001F3A55AF|nr:ethylbenzene dehydrogenase-related protein [Halomonas alkalisoli]MCE9682092.1 ethylbenzene dehydrogenase-related protein [Halomonas alkalisoli]